MLAESLNRTARMMNDINRDLDKANEILADMENPLSWVKGGDTDLEEPPVRPTPPSLVIVKLISAYRHSRGPHRE